MRVESQSGIRMFGGMNTQVHIHISQYNNLKPESIEKQLLPNTVAMGLGRLSNDDFIPQKTVSACPFSQISFFYFFATLALCINICLFMSLSIISDF